ncbi:MAG: FAD-dependent oxidoreductase [Mycoplasma sp.]
MKIVVVGINHAGTSAIRTLLEQNPNHEVVAIDRNDNISFLGCGIALSVAGVVKDTNDLFYSNPEELKSMGASVFMNTDVITIDQKLKQVHTVDLLTKKEVIHQYEKLIYAAGSWPIDLCSSKSNLENVEFCKLYQHAQRLIAKADDESIKTVTIVGAGYIGMELVEAYHLKGKEVHLVDLSERVLANYVDKEVSDVIESKLKESNIHLHLATSVTGYEGIDKVNQVITSKGSHQSDLVIECVGFKPNHELLSNVEKIKNGSIIVNKYCQTSDHDVYALGDVAAFYDAATKTHRQIALATNAVKSGIVTACNINGINQISLDSVCGTSALCVFGKHIASSGINEIQAQKFGLKVKSMVYTDNDRCEFMGMDKDNLVTIKIVYEEDTFRLVGAQIISNDKKDHSECIFALSLAIQQELTLFKLALTDFYFLPHLNKPFNFILSAILKTLGLKYFDKK